MNRLQNWIEIDSFALMHNVRVVRTLIGESTHLLAVVKSNAYGHGFDLATEAFWRGGVDGFVVTDPADAIKLSQSKYKIPILLLHPPESSALPDLIRRSIRFGGISTEFLATLRETASRIGLRAFVHLELETGMHRLGVAPLEAQPIIMESQQPRSPLLIEGLYTHLYAPQDDAMSRAQIKIVSDFLFQLQQKNIHIPMTHIVASGGITRYTDAFFDGVRVGHALYGLSAELPETESALTWKTRVMRVGRLKKSETIGYDATYRAEQSRIVATLPVGYADGVPRAMSNTGFVLCGGKRCAILGRVSMNALTIDVSSLLHAAAGDEVVLLGRQQQQSIQPADWAQWANTIDYEIVSRLPATIQRVKQR